MPVDAGGGKRLPVYIPKAKRKPRQKPSTGPRSEVAASGGYQRGKSEAYRKSTTYRRQVQQTYVEQPVARRQQILAGPKAATGAQRAEHAARVKKIRLDRAYATRAGFHDYPMTHTEATRNERFKQTSTFASSVHPEFYKPEYRKQVYESELAKLQKAGQARARLIQAKPTTVGAQSGLGVDQAKLMKKTTDRMIREMSKAGVPAEDIAKQIQALSKDTQAPALPVLRQLTRPISAIAGGTEAALHGRNIPKAVVSGAVKNDKSFSQVLKGVGAPKWVQHVGGLGLDIALDPTTYVTFGYGAEAKVAARGALEAARVAGAGEEAALRLAREVYDRKVTQLGRAAHEAGMTPTQARAVASHPNAAQILKGSGRTAKGAKVGARGVPVRLATGGRRFEVMSSGRASVKAVSGAKATAKLLPGSKTLAKRYGERADKVAAEAVHDYRPRAVHPVLHEYERQTGTAYRAARGAGERHAAKHVRAVQRLLRQEKVPKAREHHIILAVDSGDFSKLSEGEAKVASRIDEYMKQVGQTEVGAGVRRDLIESYFPRYRKQDLEAKGAHHVGGLGQRITGTSFERRTARGPMAEMEPHVLGEYHTSDVSLPLARRLLEHGNTMALHGALQRLGALGKKIHSLDDITELGGAERAVLFERDARGFKDLTKDGKLPLNTEHDVNRLKNLAERGRLYVIPRSSYERTFGYMTRGRAHAGAQDTSFLHGFDKAQSIQKTLQTVVNPGYHVVNLIGDLFNARLGGLTTGSVRRAIPLARVMRTLDDLDKSLTPEALAKLNKPLHYPGVGDTTLAEMVQQAERHGGIRMGHFGNEIQQLADPTVIRRNLVQTLTSTKPVRAVTKGKGSLPVMRGIRVLNEMREDFVRLASMDSALRRGMSWEDAAKHVNTHHFDYSDLTPLERNFLRRVIPFYTFFARNTRLQVHKLLTRPGPYATFQKVQDESANTAGLPKDFVSRLPAYAQAGMPIALPFKVHGKPLVNYSRLPLTDLNNLNPNISLLGQNLLSRASPLVKIPFEQTTGLNVFFKDAYKNHVPAPSWAGTLPKPIQAFLGVHDAYDKKTGKMGLSWSWRADEFVRQVPQSNLAANIATPQANRHAATPAMALINYFTGPKTNVFDPIDLRHKQVQARLAELRNEIPDVASRHHPGRDGKIRDRQLDKLKKEQSDLLHEQYKLEKELGYPKPGGLAPKKGRRRGGRGLAGAGSGAPLAGSGSTAGLAGS